MQSSSLAILIPTYNRYDKLIRQLEYLAQVFRTPDFSRLTPRLSFTIADGTDRENISTKLLNRLSKFLAECSEIFSLKYYHMPGESLFRRLVFLHDSSSSSYVMFLGDDDLLILDSLELLLSYLDKNSAISTVAGRIVNVINYPVGDPFSSLSLLERPYAGALIQHSNIIARLSSYFSLNAVGVAALYYSLQRRHVLSIYIELIRCHGDRLYYGGCELLHQIISLSQGSVLLSDRPLIFRDFMYEDYYIEERREAPQSDSFPYYGELAVSLAADHVSNGASIAKSEALSLVESIISLSGELQASRALSAQSMNSKMFASLALSGMLSSKTLYVFKSCYLMYLSEFKTRRRRFSAHFPRLYRIYCFFIDRFRMRLRVALNLN